MPDKLPGGFARWGESQTIDEIIETAFQQLQQIFTGYALFLSCLGKLIAELLFENAVNTTGFLFFSKL